MTDWGLTLVSTKDKNRLFLDKIEKSLLVAVANRNGHFVKNDAVAVDFSNLALRHNKRAVYSNEPAGGQHLLHGLHVHERENGVWRLGGVDFHIVFQPLNIDDALQVDLQQLIFTFHKDAFGLIAIVQRGIGTAHEREPLQCLVACLKKSGIGNGLHQIVECIDAKTIDGILLKGCGEHSARVLG